MKSWQNGLNFSILQLNKNDVTTKLFNPSVVWQGSLVFGEVIFFSYLRVFVFVSIICATSFIEIFICLYIFYMICYRVKQERNYQDSICVVKRARERWNPVSILFNVMKKGFSTFSLFHCKIILGPLIYSGAKIEGLDWLFVLNLFTVYCFFYCGSSPYLFITLFIKSVFVK